MIATLAHVAFGMAALAAFPALGSAYVVCLIVGGGLLVIATVFGGDGHDADVGGDVGMDVHVDGAADFHLDGHADLDGATDVHIESGADHADGFSADHAHADAGALALSNWFSVRFLVYFAATFGLLGTALTYMSDVSPGVVFAVALAGGIAVGQGVHQTLRALQRTSGGSETKVEDFLNQTARVTVAIKPPKLGEVGVRVGNKEYFLRAAARRTDDVFGLGDRVVIAAYEGGTAEVVSREEHAFISES